MLLERWMFILASSSESCCSFFFVHLLWKGVWRSRVPESLCFWAAYLDFLSAQPFPERVTLTRMWIIIVIDTVVSEWLVTPGGGIMEEGKDFAFLPPPLHLFCSWSISLSDLFHTISAWLDIWIFFFLGLPAILFAFKKRKQDVVWQSAQSNVKLAGSPVSRTNKLKTFSLADKNAPRSRICNVCYSNSPERYHVIKPLEWAAVLSATVLHIFVIYLCVNASFKWFN